MFTDPLFADLGVKYARVVVSYDVMTSGDDELQRVTEYLAAAQAQGVEPLVTFEHARGAAEQCNQRKNRRKRQCRLPSARQYERQFKLFRTRFPLVRSYVPWNEINHFTQPTYRNPKAAAQFSRIARRNCRGCRIVVADILDRADRARAKKPTFRSTLRYIKRFRKALKVPRRYCGLHNYSDTNRFRDGGTKQIIKALGCREIWLTETGGIYKFRASGLGPSPSASCARRSTCSSWRGASSGSSGSTSTRGSGTVTPRFDAGLVANGKPRPAYGEVKKRLPGAAP